jgi:hypothetical protein
LSWGFTLGIFLNRDFELEFIVDRQRTTLEASGPEPVKGASLEIGSDHSTLACNFGGGQGPSREVRVAR